MKKIILTVLTLALAAGAIFAQNSSISDPDASNIGNDSARQALREVSVDRFEREGFWKVHISADKGVISGRLLNTLFMASENESYTLLLIAILYLLSKYS